MKAVYKDQKNICNFDAFLNFQKYLYNKTQITADLPLVSVDFTAAVYGEQSSHVHVNYQIRRCLL